MTYQCRDIFMIRAPSFPIDTLQKRMNSSYDIESFLQKNHLSQFMEESIFIASKALWTSMKNPPQNSKKKTELQLSLQKYFMRACTRPTPYGLFAGVALGSFAKETQLQKIYNLLSIQEGPHGLDIKPDTYWVCHLIHQWEQNPEVFSRLNLQFNPLCYSKGNRMKNPYFSNHGDITGMESYVEESSIRHSPLMAFLQEKAKRWISAEELKQQLLVAYPGIEETLVEKTLQNLLENEYLLSKLRLPAYCGDPLTHIIHHLEDVQSLQEEKAILEEIRQKMHTYSCKAAPDERQGLLPAITTQMKQLYESKNYLEEGAQKGALYPHSIILTILAAQKWKEQFKSNVNNRK